MQKFGVNKHDVSIRAIIEELSTHFSEDKVIICLVHRLPILRVIIPNRTILVRFGGISGEFGRAMVRILARRSRAKIPMVRPNELDMLPKRTKKGAIRYLPYPNSS